jgi:hypothetical protein
MTNTEILELSDKELTGRIKEERLGLTKTKLGHAVSPLDNPKQIKDLASVLLYYAFIVPRLDDNGLNLGINFSAFALMVLFNDDIIGKIISVFDTLLEYKHDIDESGKINRVHEYFQIAVDDITYLPKSYDPATRKEDFIETDEQIEYLIGIFYAIDELYYPDAFTDDIDSQITTERYVYPFATLIDLVSKYTHTENKLDVEKDQNSEFDRIYDNQINSLKLKLENLNILRDSFKSAYDDTFGTDKYNLTTVDENGRPIPVDLFSLGQCISQNDDITAEAISDIITYNYDSKAKHRTMVENTINEFLTKYKANKVMLYKFIKYITGSISLPSKIRINVVNDPNKSILAHTCSFGLEVGTHKYVSTQAKLLKLLEGQLESDTGFSVAGGSRKTSMRTRKYKNNNKHSHRKSHKQNKNKIGKRTRNNNLASKKRS